MPLPARSGLDASVLMLNEHYRALRIVPARRAFSLLFKRTWRNKPVAEVVDLEDGAYVSYNFDDWTELSQFRREFEPTAHDWVRTIRFDIAVPRIIRILTYSKIPRQPIKFNRRNIFARDHNRCQYCGRKVITSELSLDHVIPRSQNGTTTWENVVCSCVKCNVKKGGRTPAQAHMKLVTKPIKPTRTPIISLRLSEDKYRSWKQFLDAAYWNVELG